MPYDATISSYHNDPKVVMNLVATVTKYNHISHRFYELKRKLLSLDHLEYADRSAPVGRVSRKIPFTEGVKIVRDGFAGCGEAYPKILDSFLENGQIDAFPKRHKDSGAFCASGLNQPTLVLLNYVDEARSVETFGHEMGHAIHSELSKSQPPMYQDYSTSVAETASTFFEAITFEKILAGLSDEEKITALHDKINDDVSTIFRQIAFFNFELELHTTVRAKGFVAKEEIAKMLNRHMENYLGPAFKLKDLDGYFFVQVSHFRRFFYVYSYAFGQLISKALFERYKKDPTYFAKIEQFLRAGGSDTPENIFKKIGINLKDPAFYELGLKSIEADIARLEKLVAEKK
jgi:oligoendopeptidase F